MGSIGVFDVIYKRSLRFRPNGYHSGRKYRYRWDIHSNDKQSLHMCPEWYHHGWNYRILSRDRQPSSHFCSEWYHCGRK